MASTSGESDKRNWKLLVDPCLKKGLSKLYRFDGICQGSRNANHNVVLPTDPRTHIPRFYARSEPIDMPLPSFKIDDNYIGAPPAREVSFFGLNDNINKAFLLNLCGKCGEVEEQDVRIYYHPKTKLHLGLASVIFKKIRGAKICLERYHRASVMGKTIDVTLDPFGAMAKESFRELIGNKSRHRDPEPAITPPPTSSFSPEKPGPRRSSERKPSGPSSTSRTQPHARLKTQGQSSSQREQGRTHHHLQQDPHPVKAARERQDVPTPPPPPQLIPEDPLIVRNSPNLLPPPNPMPRYGVQISGTPHGAGVSFAPQGSWTLPPTQPPWPVQPNWQQQEEPHPSFSQPMMGGPLPFGFPGPSPSGMFYDATPLPQAQPQRHSPPAQPRSTTGNYPPSYNEHRRERNERQTEQGSGQYRRDVRQGAAGREYERRGREGRGNGGERDSRWREDRGRRRDDRMERNTHSTRDYNRSDRQERKSHRSYAYEDSRKRMEVDNDSRREQHGGDERKRGEERHPKDRHQGSTRHSKSAPSLEGGKKETDPGGDKGGKNSGAYDDIRRIMAQMFLETSVEDQGTSSIEEKVEGMETVEVKSKSAEDDKEDADPSQCKEGVESQETPTFSAHIEKDMGDESGEGCGERLDDGKGEGKLEDGECEEEEEDRKPRTGIRTRLEAISSDSDDERRRQTPHLQRRTRERRSHERRDSRSHSRGVSRSSNDRNRPSRESSRSYHRRRRRRSRSYSDESVDSYTGDRSGSRRRRRYPDSPPRRGRERDRDHSGIPTPSPVVGETGAEKPPFWKARLRVEHNRRRTETVSSGDSTPPAGTETETTGVGPGPSSVGAEEVELSLESRIQSILHGAQKEVIKAVIGKEDDTPTPVQDEPVGEKRLVHAGKHMAKIPGKQRFAQSSRHSGSRASTSGGGWMGGGPPGMYPLPATMPCPPIPPGVDAMAYQQQMMHMMQMNMPLPFPPFNMGPYYAGGAPSWALPPPPALPSFSHPPDGEGDREERKETEHGVSVTRGALGTLGSELKLVLRKDMQRRVVDGSACEALDLWWDAKNSIRPSLQSWEEQKDSRALTEQKQAEEMEALVVAPLTSAIAELFGRKSEESGPGGLDGLPGFGLRASMPHFKVPKKKVCSEEEKADLRTPDRPAKDEMGRRSEEEGGRRRISSTSSSGSDAEWKRSESRDGPEKDRHSPIPGDEGEEDGGRKEQVSSSEEESESETESESEELTSSEEDESSTSNESDEDNMETNSKCEDSPNKLVQAQKLKEEMDSMPTPILQRLAPNQGRTLEEELPPEPLTEKPPETGMSGPMVLSGLYNPWAYDHFYMVPPRKWPKSKKPLGAKQGRQQGCLFDGGIPLREVKPPPEYKKRPVEVERDNIYRFLQEGLDQEDAEYLNQGFEELKGEAEKFPWVKKTCWIPHPVAPKTPSPPRRHLSAARARAGGSPSDAGRGEPKRKRPRLLPENSVVEEPSVHKTGSARTEGYYKITHKEKKSFMRRATHAFERTIEQNIQDVQAAKQQAQVGREARANQRRILSQLGSDAESSDLLKINQLKFRKKLVKFGRSLIHGWGLFALETIQSDEMIVEYVGEKVRFNVAERRELHYERTGIGSSYLFRVDMDQVIDATKQGALARFINHSCSPSCYAKVITVDGEKRIVIYSKEVIRPGEEITYDYKFPLEDDKIPCLCGAPNCRGSLN